MGAFESKKKSKSKKKEDDITRPKGVYGYSIDGVKREMDLTGQDYYHMFGFETEGSTIRYIGVYDGHGDKGKYASEFVGNSLTNFIVTNKTSIKKWNTKELVTNKFTEQYKKIQSLMLKNKDAFELSGSCCISALVIDKFVFVINLGDSRAVIGSKGFDTKFAIQMSTDQKPNNFEEQERIIKMGGEVTNYKDNNYGPYRVYKNNGENIPGLAVARSLGDLIGHECGISEIPQVSFKVIDSQDEFIIIGSDGVFDVMNSVEIVGYVFERLEEVGRDRIAIEIVEECRKRWTLLNKYKDETFMEKIMSDSSINQTTKNMIQSSLNNINNNNNQNSSANVPNSPAINSINNQNNIFANFQGMHNIDDITCVICFFK